MLLTICHIDILGVTETHLHEEITDVEIFIEGYQISRRDRQHKIGGGCLVDYKANLDFVPKPELTGEYIEAVWLEVTLRSQRLLIGNVYRAPDNNEFYYDFKQTLDRIWLKRNNILVMGDFNSDLMKTKANNAVSHQGKHLKRIIESVGLTNIITEPIRIGKSSETLLDLILVSNISKIQKAGTYDLAISDHKLIYTVVKLTRNKELPEIRTVKNYKSVNKGEFKLALQNVPWWISNVFDDLDDVVNTWELLYKDVVNEFITERKVKLRKNSLPWVDLRIRKLLNKRFKLLKIWQQTKSPEAHKKYKEARNVANITMRKAEANYWRIEFSNATNSKEFWQLVKKIHWKTKTTKIGPLEDNEGNIQTNDNVKADLMNNYFATVGNQLAQSFPPDTTLKQFINRLTRSVQELKIDKQLLLYQLKTVNPN